MTLCFIFTFITDCGKPLSLASDTALLRVLRWQQTDWCLKHARCRCHSEQNIDKANYVVRRRYCVSRGQIAHPAAHWRWRYSFLYHTVSMGTRALQSCSLFNYLMVIIVPRRIIWSLYTGSWWVGCYIRYNEEGPGRAGPRTVPSSLYGSKCNSPPINGQCTNHHIGV